MRIRRCIAAGVLALMGIVLVAGSLAEAARAQRSGQQPRQLQGVGIDRQLGEQVPLNLTFTNTDGEVVRLGSYFGGEKPVILHLAYYDCPMLCPLMLDGLTETLRGLAWTPGDEFEVLTISFNHRDTPEKARRVKSRYVDELGKAGAAEGWHYLTGEEEAIRKLTEAVGYRFRWVEQKQEFAHPAALMFLSGEGTITRYIYGMTVPADDARKALVEASDGAVGNILDQVLLKCFQFDPGENSYVADAFNIMRLGGLLTMILLGGALFYFWRRERDQLDESEAAGEAGEAYA